MFIDVIQPGMAWGKVKAMKSGKPQSYAVREIPENGKRAGSTFEHEHEPADIETFLGALQ